MLYFRDFFLIIFLEASVALLFKLLYQGSAGRVMKEKRLVCTGGLGLVQLQKALTLPSRVLESVFDSPKRNKFHIIIMQHYFNCV